MADLTAKINRIDTNVKNALAKIAEKGVTVPSGSNSDDLETLISSIEVGSGGGITPVGTIDIDENGRHDVSAYAFANVNVPSAGGDDGTGAAVVERSATEYTNNSITAIASNVFRNHSTLTKLHCPNVTSIGEYGLHSCSELSDHDLRSVKTLGAYAMYGCTKIGSLNLPELESTSSTALSNIKQTSMMNFPKLNSVGTSTFSNSSGIEKIDIGGPVQKIGNSVFYGCSNLAALILRSETFIINTSTNSFNNSMIAKGTGYIYVPRALVDTYKAATNWSTYAAQIRAIEDYPEITGG